MEDYTFEQLIDDNGSLVFIIRNWLTPERASQLFDRLVKIIPWQQDKGVAYGKTYNVPRLTYSCGESEIELYEYSKRINEMNPWIDEVRDVRDRIMREYSVILDSSYINYYRDPQHYIAWHADREARGANGDSHVFTVSLGGSRRFWMKEKKEKKGDKKIKTVLHNGDLCVMSGQTQRDWLHHIPKETVANPRISLTYRMINDRS